MFPSFGCACGKVVPAVHKSKSDFSCNNVTVGLKLFQTLESTDNSLHVFKEDPSGLNPRSRFGARRDFVRCPVVLPVTARRRL